MTIDSIDLKNNFEIWLSLWHSYGNQIPFLHPAWHEVWQKTLGTSYTPFYLLCNNVIFPFVTKDHVIYFSGGTEIADYLDCIGNKQNSIEAWKEVISYLKSQNITAFELHNIPETSGTKEYFQSQESQVKNISIKQEDTTPTISLPSSWDNFSESLPYKSRHEIKRKMNKFIREYPNTEIKSNKSSSGLQTLFTLMKLNPVKDTFLTKDMEQFFTSMYYAFSDTIEFLELTSKSQVISSIIAFKTSHEILLYNSGYNANFKGSGFYLKAKSIDYAIRNQLQSFNFLQGNERYKYELGGKDFFVYSISGIM
jgi:hypothetical protein